MDRIYSQARQVLIWLGEETEHDSEAFDAMSQINVILPTPPSTRAETHAINSLEYYAEAVASLPRKSLFQMGSLLQRPWFQRVWVIQEVVVARSAQLFNGAKSVAWSVFAEAAEKIISYELQSLFVASDLAMSAFRNIVFIRSNTSEPRRPFLELLCHARDFNSTDPRDKLYALLGICSREVASLEAPNYTIPVAEVFLQYAKQQLVAGSLLHLAATEYMDDISRVTLPTWVPDWSRNVGQIPSEMLIPSLCAGGASMPSLTISSAGNILTIRGKRLSCIERIGTMLYTELIEMYTNLGESNLPGIDAVEYMQLSTKQWIWDWLTDCHEVAFGEEFSPTQGMFESKDYRSFCKALCLTSDDEDEDPLVTEIVDRFANFYTLLTRSLDSQINARQIVDEDESELRETVLDMDRYIASLTAYKHFCSDDSGRLAWVPRRAQTGDVLCVFLGAKVPHLLRPAAEGRYELIGESIVPGCMDGEVMDSDDIAVQDFVLI